MKKKFLIFALMLMAVGMSLTVVSCSSDDDEDFVQEAVATEAVSAFFEKDFSTNYSEIYQKSGFFTADEYMYLSKSVIVRSINSREEFEQAYNGKYELPDIDFTRNTLIVGLTNSLDSGETLGAVRLLNTEGNYELQVVVDKNVHPTRVYLLAITPLLFWKLYPKLPTSNLTATRIVNEVIY